MTQISSRAILNVTLGGLVLAAWLCTFFVGQASQQIDMRIKKLDRQIVTEQETIHLLSAEWAYLTRPQRLEALMARRGAPEMPAMVARVEPEDVAPAPALPPVRSAVAIPLASLSEEQDFAMADLAEAMTPVSLSTYKTAMAPVVKTPAKMSTKISGKLSTKPAASAAKKETTKTPEKVAHKPVAPAPAKTAAKSARTEKPMRTADAAWSPSAQKQTPSWPRHHIAKPIVE